MALAEHKPYSPLQEDGSQVFHTPVLRTVKDAGKAYAGAGYRSG